MMYNLITAVNSYKLCCNSHHMINGPKYGSSKSRMTKQQERDIFINNNIITYIKHIDEEKNAETLWTEFKELGHEMSISAFNTRLKKLVE
jgi:hypothetical protein